MGQRAKNVALKNARLVATEAVFLPRSYSSFLGFAFSKYFS